MTSPPGGGIVARPNRASSGPARRNEARILLQSATSGVDLDTDVASTRTSFGPVHEASAPRSATRSSIVSTSRMRGTFESITGPSASSVAARIGSAPFLLPAARIDPLNGLEPKSVKKKLKQPSFAAGVHRDEVYKGAEELGVELDDHIRTIVAALQPISAELGLPA